MDSDGAAPSSCCWPLFLGVLHTKFCIKTRRRCNVIRYGCFEFYVKDCEMGGTEKRFWQGKNIKRCLNCMNINACTSDVIVLNDIQFGDGFGFDFPILTFINIKNRLKLVGTEKLF